VVTSYGSVTIDTPKGRIEGSGFPGDIIITLPSASCVIHAQPTPTPNPPNPLNLH